MLNASRTRLIGTRLRTGRYVTTLSRVSAREDPTNVGIDSSPGPTVTSEDGTRTLRTRQFGFRPLPLPPVMDPIVQEAMNRHRQGKVMKLGEEEQTPFQRELELNVHAQALATDVRLCAFTKLLLPSHFLIPFRGHLSAPSSKNEPTPLQDLTSLQSAEALQASLVPDLGPQLTVGTSSPARVYLCAGQNTIRFLCVGTRWSRAISDRIRRWRALWLNKQISEKKDWSWDKNIHQDILKRLQALAEKQLESMNTEHLEMVASDGPGERAALQRVAYGLRVFPEHTEEGQVNEADPEKLLPKVYDLTRILNEESLVVIRKQFPALTASHLLAALKHPESMKLEMVLDKIERYMRKTK